MNLDEAQRNKVAAWIADGAKLSDIQTRLASELGLKFTYMEVRLLDEVVEAAVEQEKLEAWIIDEVRSGLQLPGLYPPNAETKARYAAFCAAQSATRSKAVE